MARVKYDVRGVEGSGGTPLPPGVYNAKITQADVTKPEGKDTRIEVILEIVNSEKDNNGKKLYEYINLESDAAKWKLKEYLESLGVGGDTGDFDTDDHLNKIIGVKTIVRPADEARGFDARAAVRRMFAIDEKLRNGGSAVTEVLDDPEPEAAAEVEPDEGEELTWAELNGMSRVELKKLNKDEEVGIAVKKSMTDDDLRAKIAEFFELPPMGPDPDEDDEEDDEEPEAEVEVEADAPEVEAEPDEAAGDEDDYDDWTEPDLKEELSQRSLSVKGSKKVLIGRLRRDDASEDKPF